jgi:hypothetical protein
MEGTYNTALRGLGEEDYKFEPILGYLTRICLKNKIMKIYLSKIRWVGRISSCRCSLKQKRCNFV